MNVERSEVVRQLARKGFRTEERDHTRFWLYVGNKKQAIWTYVSHGTGYRTLGDDLISKMAGQMKLTRKLFGQFVECSLTAEGYVSHLRTSGVRLD